MNKIINGNTSLLETVGYHIKQNHCINNNDRIVVAVSGGPDSMALLDILYKLKSGYCSTFTISFEIVVAHVNHLIREDADKESKYVEQYCDKNKIPFFYQAIDVAQQATENKVGIEEMGRKVRYAFFQQVLESTNSHKIALAHHLDDNIETMLLNIIRGCGIKGLCAMSYVSNTIIRPLIEIEKTQILHYCDENELHPCFDQTNNQDIFLRNKIRLNLIPTLKQEYNPGIVNSLLRLKEIATIDEEFLHQYTVETVDSCMLDRDNYRITFNYQKILSQSASIQQRSIREIISRHQGSVQGIETIHILDILKLLSSNIPKKKYIIGNKFTIEILKKFVARIYDNG